MSLESKCRAAIADEANIHPDDISQWNTDASVKYYLAVTPKVVLGLIEENARLKRRVRELEPEETRDQYF